MSTEITHMVDLSREQVDFIKRTVAKGATDDELQLFLHDCKRRGINPLDKLLHFTVRTDKQGKRTYTPITSIDYMRMRAAESGEYAGNDDAVFQWGDDPKFPASAAVAVWRLVGGVRCPFTATARWDEYHPDLSLQGSFMWKKMPCTMLAKCAEALALRKAFPGQLSGLYAKEEMDQAGGEPKMAPQDAKAFVDTTMAQLKAHTNFDPRDDPRTPEPSVRWPIPAEISQESQDNYVPYEEAEGEARFTITDVQSKTARNGNPYRKVFWREGSGLCYEASEFATLDQLKVGDIVSAEISKNDKGWISIKRVLEAGKGKPDGIVYDDASLFVSEGEGMPF